MHPDARFNDNAVVTAAADGYQSNASGPHDMHGNAAEWTRSDASSPGHKIVRGGSFFDAPKCCRSASRVSYPPWQRVFNVGFRVICEAPDALASAGSNPP